MKRPKRKVIKTFYLELGAVYRDLDNDVNSYIQTIYEDVDSIEIQTCVSSDFLVVIIICEVSDE